jgi:hypothetical protein
MPNDKGGRAIATIVIGAFIIGTLDILYAIAFWYPRGVAPARIFQSIAAGIYGPASFSLGTHTVAIGAALHYFIALCIVLVYWVASWRIDALVRRPIVWIRLRNSRLPGHELRRDPAVRDEASGLSAIVGRVQRAGSRIPDRRSGGAVFASSPARKRAPRQ